MRCAVVVGVLAALGTNHASAAGQEAARAAATPRVVAATRADERPRIDGRLAEAAWAAAPALGDFTQTRPAAGRAASERTEVRVLYDDAALYVGVRNLDRRPSGIVARLARRDQAVQSDWFTVYLDSYRDRRTAFAFAVNPRGVKRDFMVVNDEQEDDTWDAVWEVATAEDADGWTAEFRVPLSQLRFDRGAGAMTWGINFGRLVARLDELSHWSPVRPDVPGVVSQAGEVRGLDVPSPRRLELQPYVVTSARRAPGQRADPFHRPTELRPGAGLDLKYGLGAGLTLSATLNPDFGQVEADPATVNLTANEIRFAERRPFFTEGTDIFGVGFPQVFYSRRIGAPPRGRVGSGATFSDSPERATILGAAKVTGKTRRGWSVGVLDAVTAHERAAWIDTSGGRRGSTAVEPLTNYFVARALRDFNRGTSALGVIATAVHRESQHALSAPRATAAHVIGVDGRHRFGGGNYELSAGALGSRLLGSRDAIAAIQRNSTHGFDRPDATHLTYDSAARALDGYLVRAWLSRVGGGGWRWQAGAYAMSPGFDVNDLGFLPQADRLRQWVDASYRSLQPAGWFRRYGVSFGEAAAWTYGGERADMNGNLRVFGQFGDQSSLEVAAWRWGSQMNTNILRGAGGLLEQGGRSAAMTYETDARRAVRGALRLEGWQEDGTAGGGTVVRPSIALRPTTRMDVSLAATYSRDRTPAQYVGHYPLRAAGAPGGTAGVVGHLAQTTAAVTLRGDYTVAPTLSFQLYAEPFVSTGAFTTFRTIRDGRAREFAARFRTLDAREVGARNADGVRAIDLGADGTTDLALPDPDFSIRNLNSTAVVRWEYRPGSTLFAVWGHGRNHATSDGRASLARSSSDLLNTAGTHVFMLKASYWFGL